MSKLRTLSLWSLTSSTRSHMPAYKAWLQLYRSWRVSNFHVTLLTKSGRHLAFRANLLLRIIELLVSVRSDGIVNTRTWPYRSTILAACRLKLSVTRMDESKCMTRNTRCKQWARAFSASECMHPWTFSVSLWRQVSDRLWNLNNFGFLKIFQKATVLLLTQSIVVTVSCNALSVLHWFSDTTKFSGLRYTNICLLL